MNKISTFIFSPPVLLFIAIDGYQKYANPSNYFERGLRKAFLLLHRICSALTSSDIAPNAKISKGVQFPHLIGVVIHGDSIVGEDCMIMQGVTLGQLAESGAPVLGRRVYVGAGAKILGPVFIGDGARIGANAVVMRDVPPESTAVGVPAKIVRQR
jgi:serine O-acetyltransferase